MRRIESYVVASAAALALVSGTELSAQCITPDPGLSTGFRANTTARYWLGSSLSDEELNAVQEAMREWRLAHGNRFVEVSDVRYANLRIYKQDLGTNVAAAVANDREFDSDGFLTKAVLFFSNDTSLISGWDGYNLAARHELGHTMGLGETNGQNGESVMNAWGGPNDERGWQSRYITPCDESAAREYSPSGDPDCTCPTCYPPLDGFICQPYDVFDVVTGCCKMRSTPLVLSTTGSPVEMSSAENGVLFDILANGIPQRISWTGTPTSAWLVLDRNGNGTIDDGSELFGSSTPLVDGGRASNGFEALADLDTNNDGWIDSRDARFGELRLWTDINRNGVSESGELSSLERFEIDRISLGYRLSRRTDQWGNVFRYRSDVMSGGRPHLRPIFDVLLVAAGTPPRPGPCSQAGGVRTTGGGR